ncbi:unnamed protein product [Microthlaspi erraticum]|uniref:3'-5' exonuclease domain-containing protein n=1 Tax=Microthlaspi erraticum TaxID=1685480 RepID=A0A6D2L5E5_9BRAS|nr:unnamed protein product [Microthlaspi erraticum]
MAPTIKKIASEFYYVDFFGEGIGVTVTESPSLIRRWIYTERYRNRRRYASDSLVVGVGVQWTPGGSDPPPDVLHLCVSGSCLIVQLSYCNRIPNVLRRFLADRRITFVGVWNSQDKEKLAMCRHKLEIWRLLDMRHYMVDEEDRICTCSFEKIVKACLGHEGVRLEKRISMSDWDDEFLSHDQILQAAVDSYVCSKIGANMRLWNVGT